MDKVGWRAETMGRWPWGGPLTLEKYHRFFVDPWSTRLTNDQLNQIITMHGFVKLQPNKSKIMRALVGPVDLQAPRRSTLSSVARTPAAASIGAAQAAADVDAIGWTECPIGSVTVFAGYGEDPPERLEPMPPPADHVLALVVRRARSKRTRASAYPSRAASEMAEVKEEDMKESDMEEVDIWQPPPSPPPLWMRSPTPPPPSPPPLWMRSPTPPPPPSSPPQTLVSPPPPSSPCSVQTKSEPILSPPPSGCSSSPPPGFSSPRPPGFSSSPAPCWSQPTLAPLPTPPSGFVSPPPPCWHQPTLAPLPAPPQGFGMPPPPQLYWGLPLPMVPGDMVPPPSGPGAPPAFTYHRQPAGPPPLWRPTVPPSYPAPCWGAPSVLPPQQAPWRWRHPPPRWAPPPMLQEQRPPPPLGCMEPSAPPPMPPHAF